MGKGSHSQHDENKKYIWALSDTRTVFKSVFPSFSWKPFENRTINSRDITKSCKPISFHLSTPCRDPRDPAAILAILPRSCCDNHNNRFVAIDRHCFLVQLCDRGSQVNDKIIADRHCFLVGPVNFINYILQYLGKIIIGIRGPKCFWNMYFH